MSASTSEREGEKRRRIIEAGRFLFLRNGLRGTTMEAIARQAQIAKPTLYAHFADKEAVYSALVDAILDELNAAFREGMDGSGDLAQRIGAALAHQFATLNRMLAGSPHASELMAEHKSSSLRLRDKDAVTQREIAAALDSAGVKDADGMAHLVMASAYGIALKTPDEGEMTAAIMLACQRLLGPELS